MSTIAEYINAYLFFRSRCNGLIHSLKTIARRWAATSEPHAAGAGISASAMCKHMCTPPALAYRPAAGLKAAASAVCGLPIKCRCPKAGHRGHLRSGGCSWVGAATAGPDQPSMQDSEMPMDGHFPSGHRCCNLAFLNSAVCSQDRRGQGQCQCQGRCPVHSSLGGPDPFAYTFVSPSAVILSFSGMSQGSLLLAASIL